MRVLLLSTQRNNDATGVRYYCDALESALVGRGIGVLRKTHHEVGIWQFRLHIFLLHLARIFGRDFQQIVWRWTIYWQAKAVVRQSIAQVDVVLAQDPITGAAAHLYHKRTFTTCHFSDPVDEILRASPFRPLYAWMIRKTMYYFMARNDRYITLSPTSSVMMHRYAGNLPVYTIPTICRLSPTQGRIAHHGLRIVMAGRLEPLKGQSRLIEALAYLKDLDVEVWFVGDGVDRVRLQNLAKANNLAEHVKFCGFVDDIQTIYRACDLYVHTSYMECCSLVAIEAIMSGIPAWSYETPGYNDTGLFTPTPYLAQSTSSLVLANQIKKFYQMPEDERHALWKAQHGLVQCYCPNAVAKQYEKLIEEV